VLRAAIPSAESLDDPAPLAAIWATLSRAYMRNGESERSIDAAERALPMAEAARLDMVIAEAFANKGSSLRRLGRMQEALALLAAAVEMAKRGPDRGFEIRARNNYASIFSYDDPVAATQMFEEVMDLARDVGDRGMYTWLLGNQTASAWSEGRDWDRYIDELTEAYELSTLQADRIRLHTFLTLMHCARGERVEELVAANDGLVGDDPDIDKLFSKHMVRAEAALARGDPDAAFDAAFAAGQLHSQNPEIPAMVMLRSAVVGGDADRIRRAAREVAELPAGGAWTVVQRKEAAAALAAIDGRAAEASSGFVAAHAGLTDLGQHYEAAQSVIHALTLMPDASPLRAIAVAARPMLESLRARPLIDRLDAALAAGSMAASSSGVGQAAEVPAD
jgi:tetratricopeptide (TPR) repeat protein